MGRKAGGLYINPKKFGTLSKPCMKEMLAFLNCLSLNSNNDEKCVRQKELLHTCMDSQVHIFFLILLTYKVAVFIIIIIIIVEKMFFSKPALHIALSR